MEEETKSSVTAIQGFGRVIDELSQISASIVVAAEQQDALAQDIVRKVEAAAQGTREVDGNISNVNSAAAETKRMIEEVLSASENRSEQSRTLESLAAMLLQSMSEFQQTRRVAWPMQETPALRVDGRAGGACIFAPPPFFD